MLCVMFQVQLSFVVNLLDVVVVVVVIITLSGYVSTTFRIHGKIATLKCLYRTATSKRWLSVQTGARDGICQNFRLNFHRAYRWCIIKTFLI